LLACVAVALAVQAVGQRGHEGTAMAADAGASDANRDLPEAASKELDEHAAALFDAIVHDDAERADAFFFPREPFLTLKDVADPAKYYAELRRVYVHDIHALHARRRSWDGATFVGFQLGSKPRWVARGEEWNKIGYYRTLDAKLRYEIGGKRRELTVRTIISWAGHWYVTHLRPIEHPH
jgi:hypothetical protein